QTHPNQRFDLKLWAKITGYSTQKLFGAPNRYFIFSGTAAALIALKVRCDQVGVRVALMEMNFRENLATPELLELRKQEVLEVLGKWMDEKRTLPLGTRQGPDRPYPNRALFPAVGKTVSPQR